MTETLALSRSMMDQVCGITWDHGSEEKSMVDMDKHMKKMHEEFEDSGHETPGKVRTPAVEHSFKTDNDCPKLNKKMKMDPHTFMAKRSLVHKRGRPEVQTTTAHSIFDCLSEGARQ